MMNQEKSTMPKRAYRHKKRKEHFRKGERALAKCGLCIAPATLLFYPLFPIYDYVAGIEASKAAMMLRCFGPVSV